VVVLAGLQASGKTTFYRTHLADTHFLVSKDLYRSARNKARRQRTEIASSLAAGRNVAVDNTNLSRAERCEIVQQGRDSGARVVCYYFESKLEDCLSRNARRSGRARVPDVGVRASSCRLELPDRTEGFDSMWYVKHDGDGGFAVSPWEER